MCQPKRNILIGSLAAGLLAGGALADNGASELLHRPPSGSIARQLRLKFQLMRESSGTLAAALSHNREAWERLSPEQRDRFRRRAYAFLQKDPRQQQRLLDDFEKFIKMSADQRVAYRQRAEWLNAVVASLTDSQRQQLLNLPPLERARRLIALRDELVRQGRLKLDVSVPKPAPASSPLKEPTTQPAG